MKDIQNFGFLVHTFRRFLGLFLFQMNLLNMTFQSIFSIKFISTMFASEPIFTGVMKHVRSQLSCLNKTLRANFTFIWTFAGVCLIVTIQCFFCRKTFSALQQICNKQQIHYKFQWIAEKLPFIKLTIWQVYGFSPVCDLRCLRSAPFDGNDLSHRSHINGFSPVWVLMWMLYFGRNSFRNYEIKI